MENLSVGQFVRIRRRDGRIHAAVLSHFNIDKTISVEWYENGEYKGKEVSMETVLQLNPELMPRPLKPSLSRPVMNTKSTTKTRELKRKLPARSALNLTKPNPNVLICPPTDTVTKQAESMSKQLAIPSRVAQATMQQNASRSRFTKNQQPSDATLAIKNRAGSTVSVKKSRSYVFTEAERSNRLIRAAQRREDRLAQVHAGNLCQDTAAMIEDFRKNIEFDPLVDGADQEDHQITVCVRKRPLHNKEREVQEVDIVSVPLKHTIIVHEPRSKFDLTKFLENHKFTFDYVFDERCDNEMVYKYTAKPLVHTVLEGGMATCFAYGQTGAGKTHTMGGDMSVKGSTYKNGIYALAAEDVFAYLTKPRYKELNLQVFASFFEIYGGKVFDLLANKRKLRILEDGNQLVQVVGLTEKFVNNVEEVMQYIQRGSTARTSGKTSVNSNSSRSHAIFQIILRQSGSTKIYGKFSFIDLAGNERAADTGSSNRLTRIEGAEINKSLLALKECIRALSKKSAHLPFRVSKLTHVLRDSFIGEKSKTCMIAMISPVLTSCENTLNTLRYANRVKQLVSREPLFETVLEEAGTQTTGRHQHETADETDMGSDFLQSIAEKEELSDVMIARQKAITELQQIEEVVVDQHRIMNDFMQNFLDDSRQLYSYTNVVDYDQDAYCTEAEVMFNQLVVLANSCRQLMGEFRTKLAKEELLSWPVKPTANNIEE